MNLQVPAVKRKLLFFYRPTFRWFLIWYMRVSASRMHSARERFSFVEKRTEPMERFSRKGMPEVRL